MPPAIPTCEPTQIVAGDTVKFNIADLSDFPIADGWKLSYAFRGPTDLDLGESQITQTATEHQVVIPASATAGLVAGFYRWAAYVTKDQERYQVRSGELTVVANLTSEGPGLTHNERCLAAIEAAIEGRVDADVESFQINGRAVNHIPMAELRKMRTQYRWAVYHERNRGQLGIDVAARFG